MFSKDWLRVIEIIPVRYESANGVVLTGDVMRLARCFRRFVKSETSTIHRIIQRNVGTIEVKTEVIVDLYSTVSSHFIFLLVQLLKSLFAQSLSKARLNDRNS